MLTCFFLLVPLWTGASHAATAATEDEVRAAFLFQLAQYVNWPADAGRPANAALRFCVLGQDQLTATLEPTVRKKLIQGRAVSVRRVAEHSQFSECDLAFIGFQSEKQVKATLAAAHFPGVLIVGEMEHFAQMGGMVNLVIRSGRVAFEINTAAAEKEHLEFRSQLLRFARLVGTDREGRR